ncbi:MAG: Hsp20/alpha crystallin family protein [Acidobacteria bacterium]|nr:Hsp20/alpha crystallin family protein [Acidobacteriota bacterium]MBA3887343.1 Hsp20/alpha crystallin family protein [Acidobacteriota bacterium]
MPRIYLERQELQDDVRRIIEVLEDGIDLLAAGGECAPPIDVIETVAGLEVSMDVPGVKADSLHVVFARDTLVIAGQKTPAACEHRGATFHLAERGFGRFLRAVRLTGAWNAGAADARLSCGELRVLLPRIDDRRGREIRIPVRVD